MKSLMELTQYVLADAQTWCCTSTTRDVETVASRVEDEGISFLTITLPSFCKDFESCLEKGGVLPSDFVGFKRAHKSVTLPAFLQGLLELVFDRCSGRLLDEPSTLAIFYVRQITLLHKKVLLPCSDERERNAFVKYIQCEKDLACFEGSVLRDDLYRFSRIADLLWASDCSIIDRMVYDGDLRPKHGPGKTADRTTGNGKYDAEFWHSRLEQYFCSSDFRIANSSFSYVLEGIDFLEPDAEIPVKVVSVPKTLKTPRIIAIEPTCMQYTQQALMEVIVSRLEKSNLLQGSIGFTDQTPNQRRARAGSVDRSLATIDLSEASDRVSNLLVRIMLKNYPSFGGAVQACRSTKADVPGFGIVSLTKFASMGSALCFPIEAMVFLTIVLCGYERKLKRTLSKNDILLLLPKVRVYGDDIIVPVDIVREVMDDLELFGLKVNTSKSFWNGNFRESCGKDYYRGCDVSVTYNRRVKPLSPRDVPEMLSLFSLRNQFYKAGLWRTVDYLDNELKRLAPLPNVTESSPILGRNSFLGYETEKMCKTLHRPLVKGYAVRALPKKSSISGEGALMKYFLKRGREPLFDPKHLERYGRPDAVDIKLRWGPPY